jgi:hypothetical protein
VEFRGPTMPPSERNRAQRAAKPPAPRVSVGVFCSAP